MEQVLQFGPFDYQPSEGDEFLAVENLGAVFRLLRIGTLQFGEENRITKRRPIWWHELLQRAAWRDCGSAGHSCDTADSDTH